MFKYPVIVDVMVVDFAVTVGDFQVFPVLGMISAPGRFVSSIPKEIGRSSRGSKPRPTARYMNTNDISIIIMFFQPPSAKNPAKPDSCAS